MPPPTPGIALDRASQRFGASPNSLAVLVGGGRIAQRLAREIAAVAYQVSEEDQFLILPANTSRGLGQPVRKSQSRAGLQFANPHPASGTEEAVLGRGANRPATRQAHLHDRLHALGPDAIRLSTHELAF